MINFGNIAILGDSYSTYGGYIPEGYKAYYGAGRSDAVALDDVNDTWWKSLADETGSCIKINNSWSGSAISRITYKKQYVINSSFPERLKKDMNFNGIDTLFIFGGTNDSWAGSPIGEVKYEAFTEEDFNFTLPSFCFIVDYVKTHLPDVKTVVVLNSGIKDQITDGMTAACDHYGVDCIKLNEISKQKGHPDKLGMLQIKDQIISFYNEKPNI